MGYSPVSEKSRGLRATSPPGRGIGLSTRNGTYVGTVAEVDVNRKTGAVRVTRFVCAHDCGLIINPEALRTTIEANLMQSISRALKEEVTFDRKQRHQRGLDHLSSRARLGRSRPRRGRPDQSSGLPSSGAGEPSSRAIAAAIANAVFDATGARVRRRR